MFKFSATLSGLVRDADWFHGRRARAYLVILATMSALAALIYLALSHHDLDVMGKPLGTDFASFWTASHLALTGAPASAWNVDAHRAAQAAMFGREAGYAAFFYPPTFLLACLPLALAPYAASLALWLTVTGAAWAAMTRAWLQVPRDTLLILAFPAVLVNVGHGQNGFLTAALFGAAALLCERRPWLSGALFGALVIKPHLAVLVPLFLILTWNWRAFVAAGLSAVGLCVASWLAFGTSAWLGFLDTSSLARQTLEQDLVGYAKMQSTFAAARLVGASLDTAWIVQLVSGLVGAWALWRVRRVPDVRARGAALVCATLLATPFLLDYDLTLLAIPLAWLFSRARTEGFLSWERMALLVGFLLPLISRPLATALHLPLAPIVVLAVLACVLRRAGVLSSKPAPVRPQLLMEAS